jgi:bacillolysin
MKKYILLLICLLNIIFLKAQENNFCVTPNPNLFTSVTNTGWVKFTSNSQLSSATIFTNQKAGFGLDDNYEMKKVKSETDAIGFTHTWYDEYLNNIKVLYGHFILHEKNNQLQTGNGKIYTSTIINSNKQISATGAVNKALKFVNAKKYYWQDTAKENKIKRKLNNATATYYPKPTMIYYFDETNKQLRLCYQVTIQSFDADKSGIVYIYADNGKVFMWESFSHYSCDATTVTTTWYGNQGIFTYTDAITSGWDLEDDCTASTYKVFDWQDNNKIFNSGNNQWLSPRQRSAATALWSIRQTNNIFYNVFGRNGHDNNGQNIDIYFDRVFANNSTNNASFQYDQFGDDEIYLGRGSDDPQINITDDYCTLDILAHEFTHGVDQYTSNLNYFRESGALDESFADFFGEFVENKILGSNNWLVGEDIKALNAENVIVNKPLRNMGNPITYNDPDRYFGFVWKDATMACNPSPVGNDQCGVHSNSGVQNRMCFILAVGENGFTNDSSSRNTAATGANPYQWSVSGIGIDKVARIAYRVMSVYLSSNSTYFDSRNAWVHAAEDLYGVCSFEAIQTGKAWYAVGIGPPINISTVCGTYGSSAYNYVKPGEIDIANNCAVNILTTGNLVEIKSGTKVVIKDNTGFKALEGSKFKISIINDCSFATY